MFGRVTKVCRECLFGKYPTEVELYRLLHVLFLDAWEDHASAIVVLSVVIL